MHSMRMVRGELLLKKFFDLKELLTENLLYSEEQAKILSKYVVGLHTFISKVRKADKLSVVLGDNSKVRDLIEQRIKDHGLQKQEQIGSQVHYVPVEGGLFCYKRLTKVLGFTVYEDYLTNLDNRYLLLVLLEDSNNYRFVKRYKKEFKSDRILHQYGVLTALLKTNPDPKAEYALDIKTYNSLFGESRC